MPKTWLNRLFRLGNLPASRKLELEQEGILLCEEGIAGTTTYRNFRSPNRISILRRDWFTGALVLTKTRLFALAYASQIINVPLTDARLNHVSFRVEDGPKLCVALDASLFRNDWSGSLEYRFRTDQAQRYVEFIDSSAHFRRQP